VKRGCRRLWRWGRPGRWGQRGWCRGGLRGGGGKGVGRGVVGCRERRRCRF